MLVLRRKTCGQEKSAQFAACILFALISSAIGTSRLRYNEDEIRHPAAKEEAKVAPKFHRNQDSERNRPRVTDPRRPSSSDGGGGDRYRPADEDVRPGGDHHRRPEDKPRRPAGGRDPLYHRPSYSLKPGSYGTDYSYKDSFDYSTLYPPYGGNEKPYPPREYDPVPPYGPRHPHHHDSRVPLRDPYDPDMFNLKRPYWHKAYPPHGNFNTYRYGIPTKRYRFRFIDNAPVDTDGSLVGEGTAFYLGSDGMLQCQFPEEYQIVSNIEWRRVDAPSDWLKERYAVLDRPEKQRSRLYIRHFDWRDFGYYQCVANVAGAFRKQSNKLIVKVIFNPDNAEKYDPDPSDPDDQILFPGVEPHDFHSSSGPGVPRPVEIGNLDFPESHDLSSNGLNAGPNSINPELALSSDGPFVDFPSFHVKDIHVKTSSIYGGSSLGKLFKNEKSGYKMHAENHQHDKIYENYPLQGPGTAVKSGDAEDEEDVEPASGDRIGDRIYDELPATRSRQRLLARAGQRLKQVAKGPAIVNRTAKVDKSAETNTTTHGPRKMQEILALLGRRFPADSQQARSRRNRNSLPAAAMLIRPREASGVDLSEIKPEPTSSDDLTDLSSTQKSTPSHQKHEDSLSTKPADPTSPTPTPAGA